MAGQDYDPVSGVLEFAPGELIQSVEVPVLFDPEAGVTRFGLLLSEAEGAVQLDALATAYIVSGDDEDNIPAIEEAAAPNGSDGNFDGVPDAIQSHVASLRNAADRRFITPVSPAERQTTVTLYFEQPIAVNSYYQFGPTADDEDDPDHPGKQILTVGGTPDKDHIRFHARNRSDAVAVRLNNQWLGEFPTDSLSRLVAFGGFGNDHITVGHRTDLPAELHGGPGNNRIRGGDSTTAFHGLGDEFFVGQEITRESRSPWQNPLNPLDVNGDTHVSAIDVLLVINFLSNRDNAEGEAGSPRLSGSPEQQPPAPLAPWPLGFHPPKADPPSAAELSQTGRSTTLPDVLATAELEPVLTDIAEDVRRRWNPDIWEGLDLEELVGEDRLLLTGP